MYQPIFIEVIKGFQGGGSVYPLHHQKFMGTKVVHNVGNGNMRVFFKNILKESHVFGFFCVI